MIDVGPFLPERGRFAAVAREINRLKAAVLALRPMPGKGTKVRATKIGTSIDAAPGGPGKYESKPTGEATWL